VSAARDGISALFATVAGFSADAKDALRRAERTLMMLISELPPV